MRYPTQLMHAVANLLIFFVLLAVERYGQNRTDKPPGSRIWPFDGFIFLLFVALFFLQRFVVAFFRIDRPPVLGPFNGMHLDSIVGMGVATALMVFAIARSVVPKQAL